MSLATAASPLRPARMIFAGPLVPRLVAGLAVVALWQVAVKLFMPDYVATPFGIALAFPHVVSSAPFLAALAQTMAAVAEGVLIAIVLGTALGLVIGRSVLAERALLYYVNAFYAMPILVMLPLFSLWFGYTSAARLATIVFSAIFSIILNVADGARSMPKEYLETARSFRSGRFRELVEIVLPASMPYFLAGIAAGIRARADRRGGGRVLHRHRRLGLFHPVQLAHLPPERGLRRGAVPGGLRRRRRRARHLGNAALFALVPPRRKGGMSETGASRRAGQIGAVALGAAFRRQRDHSH